MNMYVSNLGFHASDDDLRELFSSFGQVSSAKVIMDRTTGKSRGFGFVEMGSVSDATLAMKELDGKDVDGRRIAVSAAKEREERSNRKW
ncbi:MULTISPECIES: RNA recognition motif domain-containing protein [Niabella]|uniref:RNA-binding protein n=2 Tax=Niabella TaxID=379899 RepID=W0EVL5_9BACT|nr:MULTISPECIES: RNA-binding protein [Niabella]AHF14832.1 RNA-binding protein [Niabella soli DSM 19437]MCF3107540.1 RNA-binding protein [Niabella agricola]SDC97346.1 RNA recognition motif. (a.k.a. RRM, RBD, or RNP domain) [Niabella drilacis]